MSKESTTSYSILRLNEKLTQEIEPLFQIFFKKYIESNYVEKTALTCNILIAGKDSVVNYIKILLDTFRKIFEERIPEKRRKNAKPEKAILTIYVISRPGEHSKYNTELMWERKAVAKDGGISKPKPFKKFDFEFKVETKEQFEFKEKRFLQYDLMILPFYFHLFPNFRYATFEHLAQLKEMGSLIYTEEQGSIALLDGNFSNSTTLLNSDNKELRAFTEYIKRIRADKYMHWWPEIRMSDYRFFTEQFSLLFEKNYKITSREAPAKETFSLSDLKTKLESISEITTFLRKGIDLNKEDILSALENEDLGKKIDFNHKITYHLAHKFQRDQLFEGRKVTADSESIPRISYPFKWNYSTLLSKLQQIHDDKFLMLGKKAIDLLCTHDTIFPEHTCFLGIVAYDNIEEKRIFPIHLLVNKNIKEYKSILGAFSNYINAERLHTFSVSKQIFKNLKEKYPISIARVTSFTEVSAGEEKWDLATTPPIRIKIRKSYDNTTSFVHIEVRLDTRHKPSLTESSLFPEELDVLEENYTKDSKDDIKEEPKEKYLKVLPIHENNFSRLIIGKPENFDEIRGEENPPNPIPEKELKKLPEEELTFIDKSDAASEKFIHAVCKIASDFILENDYRYIFFPAGIIKKIDKDNKATITGPGGIILYEKIPDKKSALSSFAELIEARNRYLVKVTNLIFYKYNIGQNIRRDFIDKALRAELAAIISRNGSHGLGSHVLPVVAHVAKNPTENRLLFTYIQQRLDFIAQAASEFPKWSFSSWFVGDLMMRFYMQRSLLDTLVSSENLSALTFNLPKTLNKEAKSRKETISTKTPVREYDYFISGERDGISEHDIVIVEGYVSDIDLDSNTIKLRRYESANDFDVKRMICKFNLNYQLDKFSEGIKVRVKGVFKKENELSDCIFVEHKLVIKFRRKIYIKVSELEIDEDRRINRLNKAYETSIRERILDAGKSINLIEGEHYFYGITDKEKHQEKEQMLRFRLLSSNPCDAEGQHGVWCEGKVKEKEDFDKMRQVIRCGRRLILKGRIDESDGYKKLVDVKVEEICDVQYIIGERASEPSDKQNRKDLSIGVPGGVIGYQAFYTILENVIRNNAKHDWFSLKPHQKLGRNLILKIETEDIPGKDYVICKIWGSVGNLAKDFTVEGEEPLNHYIVDRQYFKEYKEMNNNVSEPLHFRINDILEERLVDEDGTAIKGNLGISELKIAAGFLSGKSIRQIGVLEGEVLLKEKGEKGFIRASAIWSVRNGELIPRLGYRIKLLKPKELIILHNKRRTFDWKTDDPLIKITSYAEFKKQSVFPDHEMCLLDLRDIDVVNWKDLNDFIYYLFQLKRMSDSWKGTEEEIEDLIKLENDILSSTEYYPFRLLAIVDNKSVWLKYKTDSKCKKLNNLWSYLFHRICLLSADTESKEKINNWHYVKDIDKSTLGVDKMSESERIKLRLFYVWNRFIRPNQAATYPLDFQLFGVTNSFNPGERDTILSVHKLFKEQILVDIDQLTIKEEAAIKFIQKLVLIKVSPKDEIKTLYGFITMLTIKGQKDLNSKKFSTPMNNIREELVKVYQKYIEIFNNLFDKKITEISSLPPYYNYKPAHVGEENSSFLNGKWKCHPDIEEEIYRYEKGANKDNQLIIKYKRHAPQEKKQDYYIEHLSGSQIFYSVLRDIEANEHSYNFNKMMLQMYENGLLKLMIIDERVQEYVNRNRQREILSSLNIVIPHEVTIERAKDDKTVETLKEILIPPADESKDNLKVIRFPLISESNSKPTIFLKISFVNPANTPDNSSGDKPYPFGFHNLIIHNTILEQFFKIGILNHGLHEKINDYVDDLLKRIKLEHVPSVIITSGKGQPHSLSDKAKFLPFSNIENFILNHRPEKILLSQILLKTLKMR